MKESELTYKIVNKCISSVMTEDTRIDADEVSEQEMNSFIESMNSQQFKMITDYIATMPTLKKDVSFTCSSCSHDNKQQLSGISDFFS